MCKASLCLLLLLAQHASSLSFRVIADDGYGRRVLLIYDCGTIQDNLECTDERSGFRRGDVERMRGHGFRFEEVWLVSGGGNLVTGIELGKELHRNAMTVRVPNKSRLLKAGVTPNGAPYCVSACTVAFMGGRFRLIDLLPGDEATYQVHAGSSVSWRNPKESQKVILQIFAIHKEGGLQAVATALTSGDAEIARDLFTLFHDSLWLPVSNDRTPMERRQRDSVLSNWVRENAFRGYRYPQAELSRDEALLALEGEAALQDILMRIERRSYTQAVADLRSMTSRLGRRADAAIAILEAMYDTSSILETNNLPKETMLKMGYVTEFVR